MDHVRCTAVTADEEVTDHGEVNLQKALFLLDEFPWAEQGARAQETGAGPGFSFGFEDGDASYLNIGGIDAETVMIITEVILKPGVLGFLFRKAASGFKGEASLDDARTYVQKFFELDRSDLYEWLKKESS